MITFDGKVVHGSTFFRYLGSIIQKDGELDGDVAHRIKAGWLKWKSATGVLCDPDMPHRLKEMQKHAADERIKLEDLRLKVLSGKMKTITYLDADQEMVLPEIGYQLLQNYAAQVQSWGWICNIPSPDTSSFSKHMDFLHRQQTVVKLLAQICLSLFIF
ncbi:hypothetical protein OROMI_001172 [Orobanche minor]